MSVNCVLWSCDMNSTLGSVVPLAMFKKNNPETIKSLHRSRLALWGANHREHPIALSRVPNPPPETRSYPNIKSLKEYFTSIESVLVQEAKYFLADLYGSGSLSVMSSSSSLRIFPAEEKTNTGLKKNHSSFVLQTLFPTWSSTLSFMTEKLVTLPFPSGISSLSSKPPQENV